MSRIYQTLKKLYHNTLIGRCLLYLPVSLQRMKPHLITLWNNQLSDYRLIRKEYKQRFGHYPNLEKPTTLSEKLQWKKLNDRKPIYTLCADKYKVRGYVTEKIGEEHLIPLVYATDDPQSIDFDALP